MNVKNKIIAFIKDNKWIILILVLAALLRILFLGVAEFLDDEPLYSTRALSWVDILYGGSQASPYQWSESLPWWSIISFHDHPPLVFIIFRAFLVFFGDSILVSRLPSALFGVLNVYLIYILSYKIFKKYPAAILSALLASVNCFFLFYSRRSILESVTISFVLLAYYLFLLALKDKKYLPWFGLIFGLSFLAKYVAVMPALAYFIIILFYKRDFFKDKRFYLAIFLFLFVISPVIIYNYFMYKAVGHFDLQFSYFFHQSTPEWQSLPGKDQIGSFVYRVKGLVQYAFLFSPLFFVLSFSSVLFFFVNIRRSSREVKSLVLVFISFLTMNLLVGSVRRFMYYLLPFLFIITGYFIYNFPYKKRLAKILFFLFILYELFFSINSVIVPIFREPVGLPIYSYSNSFRNNNRGTVALDDYLKDKLQDKYSVMHPAFQTLTNLNDRVDYFYGKSKDKNEPAKILLIGDYRVWTRVHNWIYFRYSLVYGWPFAYSIQLSIPNTPEIMDSYGDADMYFIVATKFGSQFVKRRDPIDTFVDIFIEKGVSPDVLYDNTQLPQFYIYKVKLIDLVNWVRDLEKGNKKESD